MKIHVVHSASYDFKNELYSPLRSSELSINHEVFLPHESEEFIKTKDLINEADVVVAEVSFSSTGVGIELGWANAFEKTIICMYKTGMKPSGSLKAVSKTFIEYSNSKNLVEELSKALKNIQK